MKGFKKDFQPIYQKEKAFEFQLQQDLKTLAGRMEKLEGVDRVAIISAKDIIVDDKVRWKCKYPVCFGYNSSVLCPPHTPPADECERIIHSFRYAIIFQHDVPVKDYFERVPGRKPAFRLINEVAHQSEAWANSMGYRQAVAFQAGMCTEFVSCLKATLKATESSDIDRTPDSITDGTWTDTIVCAVLQGKRCRHPLWVRPSMEAMAIDVIGTIQPLGWDCVYIGGRTNDPADIPCASALGLLLVA